MLCILDYIPEGSCTFYVPLAGTLIDVQGETRCKILAPFFTVK